MLGLLTGLVGTVGTFAAREGLECLGWFERRKKLYEEAEREAKRRGKPLLVVGRPRSRDHG